MNTVNWPTGADARADALRKGTIVDWPTAADAQRDSLRRNIPPSMRPGQYAASQTGPAPAPTAPTAPPTSPLTEAARTAVGRNAPAGGRALRLAAGAAPVLGAVGSLAEDAGPVAGVMTSPNSTILDKVAAGSGAIGKAAATGAGVGIGTNVGMAAGALTGPLAPVAVPVLGALGGAAGGWVGNKLAGSALREGGTPGFAPNATPAAPAAQPGLRPTAPTTPTNFRGNGFNDPRSTTFDNTGPSRDFTKELASVPRDLPSDLRSGVIFKTQDANGRTVYSGRDVGAGAQFVDGKGATLRGGTVSTVPGMSRETIAEIMARPSAFNPNSGLTGAQQAQYQREVEDAQRINAASAIIEGRSRGGVDLRSPEYIAQRNASVGGGDLEMRPGESRAAYATRIGALTQRRGQDMDERQSLRSDGTTRRGQDMTYSSTLRGQDITARGQDITARGQDMTAEQARASALRDQANKDREFGLNLTKEQRAAREAGEKTVLDRVTGMLPLTGDPAKDGAMKAQANQRLNQLYGQEINSLRKAVAANPKDKQSAAQLKMLEENGLAAFAGNEEGLLRFALGSQAADIATGDASWIPGFGNASDSQKPVTALRYKESILPFHDGYYVTDRTLRNGKQEEIRKSQVPSDIARVLEQR